MVFKQLALPERTLFSERDKYPDRVMSSTKTGYEERAGRTPLQKKGRHLEPGRTIHNRGEEDKLLRQDLRTFGGLYGGQQAEPGESSWVKVRGPICTWWRG